VVIEDDYVPLGEGTGWNISLRYYGPEEMGGFSEESGIWKNSGVLSQS
jgi:hypothetical protein